MAMRLQSFLGAILISVAVSAPAAAQSAQAERSRTAGTAAARPAVRVKLPGLPDFAAVSIQLYRGAQPKDEGFAELEKMGVGVVVNLRHEPDEIARERSQVESRGMQYVSIPWRGKQDPKPEQVPVPEFASRES
jgi:hypothetical protein